MTHFTLSDIETRIPHKFENILLDSCVINEDSSTDFQLTISSNDSLGRDLFIKHTDFGPCIPIPILAEISALSCIMSSSEFKASSIVYFAAITKFSTNTAHFLQDTTITGTTQQISEKHGFYKYKFNISAHDNGSATGEIMAFYPSNSDLDTNESELTLYTLPEFCTQALQQSTPIAPMPSKASHMTFCNAYHPCDSDSDYIFSYQYPSTHPLIRGHFPNHPVMMGVCQWGMLEDAMAHLLTQLTTNETSTVTVCVNATIFKADHSQVCQLKQITMIAQHCNTHWDVHTKEAKKILFKQPVLPGDTIYVHISNLVFQ